MVLESIGVGEIDGMGLVRILRDVGEMEAEGLAETAELNLTLVLQAELECLLSDLLWRREYGYVMPEDADSMKTHLVDVFQPCIVLQSLQSGAVTLPEELEPRGNKSPIGPVLGLIPANGAEEDGFGSLTCLKIVDVESDGLVGLFLCFLHLCVGELDEAVHDYFDGRYARVLSNILVLHEAFFRRAAFSELDTELNKPEYDGLERCQRSRAETLRGEHFGERLESGVGLADRDQALCLLEDRLGF